MKLSTHRILTTHVGSLPRPDDLIALLYAKEKGDPYDEGEIETQVSAAVTDIVGRQVSAGLDVVSDGEMSKIGYSTYLKDRLNGFGREGGRRVPKDLQDYPDYSKRLVEIGCVPSISRPLCEGPIEIKTTKPLESDLANFKTAVTAAKPVEAFMNAASPGVAAVFMVNDYYPTEDAYLEALANVLKVEYEAIHKAGFVLQIDCPDLAMGRHMLYPDESNESFLKFAAMNVEALNHATADIPADDMRMHICWGNYPGPHHHDIPLEEILGIVFEARPAALLLEGANPRHEHEWDVFKSIPLPDDKVLIPGVIDSTSNYIEHPKLIAQRLCRYAEVVGKERVMAGSDCGFSTFAGVPQVFPSIVWAKFEAMVEGARLASEQLWR